MELATINKELEMINSELSERDVPIHARPIHAIMEFGKKHKLSLPIVSTGRSSADNNYPIENEYITDAIHAWYENMYSDSLKIAPDIGKTLVLVNGDPMAMRLPLIYGQCEIQWDIIKTGITGAKGFNKGPNILNVIDVIDGLTITMAKNISHDAARNIVHWFLQSYETHNFITNLDQALVKQALTDLKDAVSHITSQLANYGQARWSTLQACEKLMKAYMVDKEIPYRNGHYLEKVAKNAEIDSKEMLSLLPDIQCPASVRYGEVKPTKLEAIKAYQSTMVFLSYLVKMWPVKGCT